MKYEKVSEFEDKPPPRYLPFVSAVPIVVGAVFGLIMRLLFGAGENSNAAMSAYSVMLSSFVLLVPAGIGAITVYLAERVEQRSWAYYLGAPIVSNALFVAGTLLLLIEGWICAILILPLFCVIGAVGGWIMGTVCRSMKWPKRTVGAFAVLPLIMAPIEAQLPVPNEYAHASHSIHIQAPPEVVWRSIIHAEDIHPDEVESWAFRIGVPKPLSGVAAISDGKLIRRMTMGKNISFDQICTDWRENAYLHCTYEFTKESFPNGALDDHVMVGGKYFDIKDTAYTLTPAHGGTDLRISMRYRMTTSFNWYTVPLTKRLFTNLEENILEFYKRRSELRGASIASLRFQ